MVWARGQPPFNRVIEKVGTDHTVFVVDDDSSVLKATKRLLTQAGYQVEAYLDLGEFRRRLIPEHPCCLVLDLRLGNASGLDFQAELSRNKQELPVIFITGHGDVPTSVSAMKAGAVDFLEKPFGEEALLEAVRQALEKSRRDIEDRRERSQIEARLRQLTPREREVLEWVVTGLLNKQIAGELGASEKTIKVHRGRVMRKMKAESLADLVRMSQKVGISGAQSS